MTTSIPSDVPIADPRRARRNNVLCALFNLHKFDVIHQHWQEVPELPGVPALVRFEECVICGKTKASMTHPYKDVTCQASPVFSDMRYSSNTAIAK